MNYFNLERVKKMRGISICMLVIAMLFIATQAQAVRLKDDVSSIINGTANVSDTVFGMDIEVDVEYAVYSPGTYSGLDNSGGSDYIYAYQVFNKGTSDVSIDFYTVGIVPGAVQAGTDFIYEDSGYGEAGGVAASMLNFYGTPVHAGGYGFSASIPAGSHSQVLIFTSDYSYIIGNASLTGQGLATSFRVPTANVPEPASIAIFGTLAGVSLFGRRSRKTS